MTEKLNHIKFKHIKIKYMGKITHIFKAYHIKKHKKVVYKEAYSNDKPYQNFAVKAIKLLETLNHIFMV